jgi:hypothetical protein
MVNSFLLKRNPTPLSSICNRFGANPDFSRARAVQEEGISARRRSVLLRGLNNAVPVPPWFAFGEEHQMPFFILRYYSLQFRT